MKTSYVFAVVAAVSAAGVAPARAEDGDINSIEAEPTAPLASWTAAQQWVGSDTNGRDDRTQYGYGSLAGAITLADELGPKLGQLGRMSLVAKCFGQGHASTEAALLWAICGSDVAQVDLKKLQAELVAAKISEDSRADVMMLATAELEHANQVGVAVVTAAKDDPGVASILKLHDRAVAEWTAFQSANQPMIDRYLALKDAVRSGKSNHKGFAGCYEATKGPFEKVVKATKWPWQVQGDPLPFYVSYLVATTEGYFATVAYGACAYSQHAAGESLYVAAANQKGGHARSGFRSITLALAYADAFKPKFAERSLRFEDMKFEWQYGIQMPGVQDRYSIMTPREGTVAKLTPNGDSTTVTFAKDTVDACLQWQDTRRVSSIDSSGNIYYEKKCMKRGNIPNEIEPADVPAKYTAGIAKGVNVTIVNAFPVVAWKGKKLTAMLGIALK